MYLTKQVTCTSLSKVFSYNFFKFKWAEAIYQRQNENKLKILKINKAQQP